MLQEFLKKELKKPSRRGLLNLVDDIRSFGSGNNLERLARIYRSDKALGHSYASHYQNYFRKFRYKKVKLLEIGVGGYSYPHLGGNSLRMWKKYFPFGRIFSFDIHDKTSFEERRIRIFCGSQVDEEFLERLTEETGPLDIIIDDGSHQNEHVIKTFQFLFPKLNDGGIYVIEDTQTSYWKEFGGDSEDLEKHGTMMNYFKKLTDCLNYEELVRPGYTPSYLDKNIVGIHFYHNLIIIEKGSNNEGSNILINNSKRKHDGGLC